MIETATFTCSICGESSTEICVYCTKDTCSNHRCERCHRCSDCCECDIPLVAPQPEPEPDTTAQAVPEALEFAPPAGETEQPGAMGPDLPLPAPPAATEEPDLNVPAPPEIEQQAIEAAVESGPNADPFPAESSPESAQETDAPQSKLPGETAEGAD